MKKSEQDMSGCTDEELFRLVTQSEKSALIILFDRYAADLYSYILPLVRTRKSNNVTPEAVTQYILIDIFMRVWDNRKTLVVPVTIRAYLFSAAYNKAVDYMRYRKNYVMCKVSS